MRKCNDKTCKFYDIEYDTSHPESGVPLEHNKYHVKGDYFCYYELHVDDKTFYQHVLIPATDIDNAFEKMHSKQTNRGFGKSYHLQVKGCLGIYDIDEHRKFMTSIGGGIRFE